MFEEMLQTAAKPKQGFLAAGLGLLVLLFGATGVFVELRDALNLIWKVPASGGVLRGLLRGRLLAFTRLRLPSS
jgi:membrane protein